MLINSECLYLHYKFIIIASAISIILGLFSLFYYFKNENELHKVAFISIIGFGIITAIITPILAAPDEIEHFARGLLTSQGILFPKYIFPPNNYTGLTMNSQVIPSMTGFYTLYEEFGRTFLDSKAFYTANDQTTNYFAQAFIHNPFYGYLAQGFGIFIARILNLNTIWMLWLGRICNLILYASIIYSAIKKTPILKVPCFLWHACLWHYTRDQLQV